MCIKINLNKSSKSAKEERIKKWAHYLVEKYWQDKLSKQKEKNKK